MRRRPQPWQEARASISGNIVKENGFMVARLRQRSQSELPETNPVELASCGLAPTIVERLAAVGVNTVADWLTLSRRAQSSIWGVTGRGVREIDAAVASAMRGDLT